MELQVGKTYRDEYGNRVGPLKGGMFKWVEGKGQDPDAEWANDGKVRMRGPEGYGDLIAEWTDGPVFTVGAKVRRIAEFDDLDLPKGFETVVEKIEGGGFIRHRDAAGDLRYRHSEEYELITDGPVRTVTRREVVAGSYGRLKTLKVAPSGVSYTKAVVSLEERFYSREDLTEIIDLLAEVRDGLELAGAVDSE